jgi:hypothetical protein
MVKSYQRNKLLTVTFCDDRQGDAKTFNLRLSVTSDDFCVVRHIFKTFLCLKIQNCLTHRIYIDRLSCVDKTSYFKVMHTTLDFLLNEPVFSKFIRDMT